MYKMRVPVLLALLVLLGILCGLAHAVNVKLLTVGPLAHVQYLDEVVNTKMLVLQPGQRYTLTFGLPPSDAYSNYLMIVQIAKPSPYLQVLCRGACTYQKNELGLLEKIYVSRGNVTLLNAGVSTYAGKITVIYIYSKEYDVQLSEPVVKISLKVPDETGEAVSRQIVKVWVDNNAPYMVHDIILPNNKSYTELTLSGYVIKGVKVEPKYVEIDASEAPHGTYTIVLTYSKSAVLGSVLLVKALSYMNTTVEPRDSMVISSSDYGVPKGWKVLGYIVAVTAIQPTTGERGGSIRIIGDLVSPISTQSGIINVRMVSYLIPPLMNFRYLVGAYIAYGSTVKVLNNMSVPILVYYIPLLYKSIGEIRLYNKTVILSAEVDSQDLESGIWNVLVVQVPPYAEIEKILTPDGTEYSTVTESRVAWGSTTRLVSIAPDRHQAIITVSFGDMREPGLYRIYLKTEPLTMRILTSSGRPCMSCRVKIRCGKYVITLRPNKEGYVKIDIPYILLNPAVVDVYYDGKLMYEVALTTIPVKPLTLKIRLYNVTIVVTNYRGEPIQGAKVVLVSSDGTIVRSALTDKNGVAVISDLPSGIYTLKVYVGGKEIATGKIEVTGNRIVKINSSVVAVFTLTPFGTIVITTTAVTIAAAVIVGGIAVALTLRFISRERSRKEQEEVLYS